MHQESEKCKIEKGVRQGDLISPKLYCAVLESVFQKLNWDEVGIKFNGEYLHHLRNSLMIYSPACFKCRRTTNQNGRTE